ncbi:hypothetical protein D3C75_1080240 [compost metagenome]
MISHEVYLSSLQLNQTYWACADGCADEPVQLLFIPSGRLQLSTLELVGRDQIERFFTDRASDNQKSGRTTRHFSSGFTPEMVGSERLLVKSLVMVFAGSGALPLPSESPSTIADVEDVLVLSANGQWLFESRLIKPVFVGSSAAKFAQRT